VKKISPPPPTGLRSPDRPASNESLHRRSYPGPKQVRVFRIIYSYDCILIHFGYAFCPTVQIRMRLVEKQLGGEVVTPRWVCRTCTDCHIEPIRTTKSKNSLSSVCWYYSGKEHLLRRGWHYIHMWTHLFLSSDIFFFVQDDWWSHYGTGYRIVIFLNVSENCHFLHISERNRTGDRSSQLKLHYATRAVHNRAAAWVVASDVISKNLLQITDLCTLKANAGI
jgi:hypothetical protein